MVSAAAADKRGGWSAAASIQRPPMDKATGAVPSGRGDGRTRRWEQSPGGVPPRPPGRGTTAPLDPGAGREDSSTPKSHIMSSSEAELRARTTANNASRPSSARPNMVDNDKLMSGGAPAFNSLLTPSPGTTDSHGSHSQFSDGQHFSASVTTPAGPPSTSAQFNSRGPHSSVAASDRQQSSSSSSLQQTNAANSSAGGNNSSAGAGKGGGDPQSFSSTGGTTSAQSSGTMNAGAGSSSATPATPNLSAAAPAAPAAPPSTNVVYPSPALSTNTNFSGVSAKEHWKDGGSSSFKGAGGAKTDRADTDSYKGDGTYSYKGDGTSGSGGYNKGGDHSERGFANKDSNKDFSSKSYKGDRGDGYGKGNKDRRGGNRQYDGWSESSYGRRGDHYNDRDYGGRGGYRGDRGDHHHYNRGDGGTSYGGGMGSRRGGYGEDGGDARRDRYNTRDGGGGRYGGGRGDGGDALHGGGEERGWMRRDAILQRIDATAAYVNRVVQVARHLPWYTEDMYSSMATEAEVKEYESYNPPLDIRGDPYFAVMETGESVVDVFMKIFKDTQQIEDDGFTIQSYTKGDLGRQGNVYLKLVVIEFYKQLVSQIQHGGVPLFSPQDGRVIT